MSQHTPGPWAQLDNQYADRDETHQIITHPDNSKGGKHVCFVDGDANAHLIAAAPEMLEALNALCAWSDHSSLTGLPSGAPVAKGAPSFDATVKMVRAAIARAEGRA